MNSPQLLIFLLTSMIYFNFCSVQFSIYSFFIISNKWTILKINAQGIGWYLLINGPADLSPKNISLGGKLAMGPMGQYIKQLE